MMDVKDLAQFGVPRKSSNIPIFGTIVIDVSSVTIVIINIGWGWS